ncbi:GNAT family N-acetyltransferase [Sphingobium sufflavum]|uniref:GNAT family N-acetyltransferase n=1 Tax=Sphingobium sufflavum TaxID=1129547 RepID=UPI001F2A4886|nr:GNAT family N-acetyltransferase [Sphingobium sufflavum]MCE7795013.1 GNAT family N-acetyltransferase [Sphingobium sufflavum]
MFARTERLILRPSWPEDAEPLAKALSDPAIARTLLDAPTAIDPSGTREWIGEPRDPRLPDFLAFMRTRGAPRLVGGAGISRREDGKLELRYWIERSHWGLGYATEATRAVMRIARATGLMGVRAGHLLDNPASARVLRKIGFSPTGRIEPRLNPALASDVAVVEFEYDGRTQDSRDTDEPAREIYSDKLFAWA